MTMNISGPPWVVDIAPVSGGGKADVTLDICSTPYNVRPGDDITAIVQALVNTMTAGASLEIVISKAGVYYMNGAQQTGTYVSPPKTTTSGSHTLPTASITLTSVGELPPCGEVTVGGQLVAYQGISGNVLQNCTGGTGTIASGSDVCTAMSYSGAVLLPALAWRYGNKTSLRIRGMVKPTFGDPSTGDSIGVRIETTTNTTNAYLFAAVPYSSMWGGNWTGVMPRFEDLTFSFPQDPQSGAVDARACIHAEFDSIICGQGNITTSSFPTGTTEAIRLPNTKNNGFVAVRNSQIRNWGAGIRMSEHCVFDNVQLSYCNRAFTSYGGGHPNWFGYVDVEECATVIYLAPGVTNTVNGHLDIENVALGTSFAPTSLVELGSSNSVLFGALDIMCNPLGSLGIKAPSGQAGQVLMDMRNLINPRKFDHPIDTMQRLQSTTMPAGTAPGLTWPTLEAWRVLSGQFQMTVAGQLTNANGGSSSAYLPARDGLTGARSRRVQFTITTPASSYDISLVAHRQQTGANAVYARLTGGNLSVYVGANDTSGAVKTVAGITGSTTYTVAIDVVVSGGLLVAFRVWLNGVLQYEHACTSAQRYGSAGNDPYLMDGIYIRDNGANLTKVTAFQVAPVELVPSTLTSGTATLAAGTVTVALPSISASSVVRLVRQAAGGTPGHLSLVLNAGTGFTINSSSGADTSTVFWEIVSI